MKYKLFVFSDVHGEAEALEQSLKAAGYDKDNPTHKLVSVGDLFDRGNDSRYLFELMIKRDNNIWIKGNHEEMLEEALEKGMDGEFVFFNMLHNGLDKTIASFSGMDLSGMVSMSKLDLAVERAKSYKRGSTKLIDKIKSLPLYFETKNYIFVHAGLDPEKDWKTTPADFMTWDIKCSHMPIYSTNKTVIIGHHHAFRVRRNGIEHGYTEQPLGIPYVGNNDENAPVRFGNKIAIDPCSNLTKKVNVLIIEDELLEEPKKEVAPTAAGIDIAAKWDGVTDETIAYRTTFNAGTNTYTYTVNAADINITNFMA